MKANLTIGKWGLIAVIWLFIFLTINGMIDEMTLIKFSIGLFYAIVIISVGFWLFSVVEKTQTAEIQNPNQFYQAQSIRLKHFKLQKLWAKLGKIEENLAKL